ncbi:hypothetical protein ACN47E_003293 [Coniothyrium glycines]
MFVPAAGESQLTALLQAASYGDAKLIRCSLDTLQRIRNLHEAEIITLFTPFVPHPPSTALAKDMDPFEPLGRALPRRVRHVPYRLDHGMTEMHADFVPASGAIIIVVCVTTNVLQFNPRAFELQINFARDITKKTVGDAGVAGIPVVLLLVNNSISGQHFVDAVSDFPALVTINDYTTAALTNAVRVLFGT